MSNNKRVFAPNKSVKLNLNVIYIIQKYIKILQFRS